MLRFSLGLVPVLLVGLLVGCGAPAASGSQDIVSAGGSPDGAHLVAKPSVTPVPTNASNAIAAAVAKPSPDAALAPAGTATPSPMAVPSATATVAASQVADFSLRATSSPADSYPENGHPQDSDPPDSGPQDSDPQNSSDADELASRGLEVYRQQYCGVCHQLSAADTGGTFGPSHDGMGTTAEQRLQAPGYSGAATTPGEYILESIVDPKAYLVPGYEVTSHHMPAYAHVEEGDLEALVFMLLQQ